MSIVTIFLISAAIQIVGGFIAYTLGVRIERIRWNELIDKGIINKPVNIDAALKRTAAVLHKNNLTAIWRSPTETDVAYCKGYKAGRENTLAELNDV